MEAHPSFSIRTADGRPSRWLEALHPVCSHDLPNQLVALQSLVNLLEMDQADRLDDEGREYLARLQSVLAKTGVLVEFLKEMVRLTRHTPRREHIHLPSLARELKAHASTLPLAPTTWEVRLPLETVIGEEVAVQRSLADCLRAALEMMPRRETRVILSSAFPGQVMLEVHLVGKAAPGAAPCTIDRRPEYLLARERLALGAVILEQMAPRADVVGVSLAFPSELP